MTNRQEYGIIYTERKREVNTMYTVTLYNDYCGEMIEFSTPCFKEANEFWRENGYAADRGTLTLDGQVIFEIGE